MKCKSCKKEIKEKDLLILGLTSIHKNCYDTFISQTLTIIRNKKKKNKESIKEMSHQQAKSKAKQTAWRSFSRFIRLRDSVKGMCTCISCGKSMKAIDGRFGAQAGHFIPKSKGDYFYFNEDNVSGQCVNCNEHGSHDTGANYRKNLIKKIGKKRVEDLESMVHQRIKKPTLEDYRAIAKKYNKKVKGLTNK